MLKAFVPFDKGSASGGGDGGGKGSRWTTSNRNKNICFAVAVWMKVYIISMEKLEKRVRLCW